jgi:hypothetical protein
LRTFSQVILLVYASLGFAQRVSAESDNRIAVVGLKEHNALTRQLVAELRTLDFHVVLSDAPIASWRELRELARQLKVAAAVWIAGIDEPTIEIWVVDLVTAKTVQRSIEQGRRRNHSSSRVLAMRVIELLRASFREIANSSVPPQESEVNPSVAVRAMVAQSESNPRFKKNEQPQSSEAPDLSPTDRVILSLGPAVALSIGGIGAAAQAFIGLHWLVSYPWGISGFLRAPVVGVTLTNTNSSADLFLSSAGAGPYVLVSPPSSRWPLEIGLGVAWLATYMKGKTVDPFESKNVLATSATLYAQVALCYRIYRHVSVRFEMQTGAAFSPIIVRFADQTQGRWGRFYGIGSTGLDIGF